MKHILYLFIFLFSISVNSFAQEDQFDDGAGKLREKMVQYIQNKLSISKAEAEKFQPIFLDYLRQMHSTRSEFKGDKILLQQKIAELRLRTRDQFKPILGEARSNEVFKHERDFVEKVKAELNDRLENRRDSRSNKRTRMLQ